MRNWFVTFLLVVLALIPLIHACSLPLPIVQYSEANNPSCVVSSILHDELLEEHLLSVAQNESSTCMYLNQSLIVGLTEELFAPAKYPISSFADVRLIYEDDNSYAARLKQIDEAATDYCNCSASKILFREDSVTAYLSFSKYQCVSESIMDEYIAFASIFSCGLPPPRETPPIFCSVNALHDYGGYGFHFYTSLYLSFIWIRFLIVAGIFGYFRFWKRR